MSSTELTSIENRNIMVLSVAEIENLYLLQDVVKSIAKYLGKDADDTFSLVKQFIFANFSKEKESQICKMCERDIHYRLKGYNVGKKPTKESLNQELRTLVQSIDANQMYDQYEAEINRIIQEEDYDKLLLKYNRKSLLKMVSPCFGLVPSEYPNLVLRLLKTGTGGPIVDAMRSKCPDLPSQG